MLIQKTSNNYNLNHVMKKIIISIFLVGVCITGCKKSGNPANQSFSLPIEVALPIVQDVTLTKNYPAYLKSDLTVDLVARVNGNLQNRYYRPGQRVKKGQLLMLIEPTLYQDQVKQAEATLKTAQANLSYAKSSYERMQEAIKSDAVSRIQLLQAESNVQTYEASVNNALAALNIAKTNLGYCYIRAPFDGVVDLNLYSVGSYIGGAASPVKLATIYKDDTMFAFFNIADNQFLSFQLISEGKIAGAKKQTHPVTLTLGTDSTFSWIGNIDYLSPDVTLNTGTLMLRASLDNKSGMLRPGMYVTVDLPYDNQKNAILIDDSSIGTDQLGKYIYVVNDSNIVNYRHITIGQLVPGNLRIVNSGLSPKEKYVTKALLKVRQGMQIQPVMADEKKLKK